MYSVEASGANLTTPENVMLVVRAFGLGRLRKVSFQKHVCHESLSHLSRNSHLRFLSCPPPSRNVTPCSVRADHILGRREGARLGHGQATKIQIPTLTPASLAALRGLPPSSVKWGHGGPRDGLTAKERWTLLRVGSGKRTTHSPRHPRKQRAPPRTLRKVQHQKQSGTPEVTRPRGREPGV